RPNRHRARRRSERRQGARRSSRHRLRSSSRASHLVRCRAGPTDPERAVTRGLSVIPMRLTLGHVEGFDDTVSAFARQLGLTAIHFHPPSDSSGAEGYWAVDELVRLRERCEADGLVVEGLENVPYWHW